MFSRFRTIKRRFARKKGEPVSADCPESRYNLAASYPDQGKREAAREQLNILQKLDAEMATNLRKQFDQQYVINVAEEM